MNKNALEIASKNMTAIIRKECYNVGYSQAKKDFIKMIDEWAFETIKNFSGKDKDFFKDNVQELKSKLKEGAK